MSLNSRMLLFVALGLLVSASMAMAQGPYGVLPGGPGDTQGNTYGNVMTVTSAGLDVIADSAGLTESTFGTPSAWDTNWPAESACAVWTGGGGTAPWPAEAQWTPYVTGYAPFLDVTTENGSGFGGIAWHYHPTYSLAGRFLRVNFVYSGFLGDRRAHIWEGAQAPGAVDSTSWGANGDPYNDALDSNGNWAPDQDVEVWDNTQADSSGSGVYFGYPRTVFFPLDSAGTNDFYAGVDGEYIPGTETGSDRVELDNFDVTPYVPTSYTYTGLSFTSSGIGTLSSIGPMPAGVYPNTIDISGGQYYQNNWSTEAQFVGSVYMVGRNAVTGSAPPAEVLWCKAGDVTVCSSQYSTYGSVIWHIHSSDAGGFAQGAVARLDLSYYPGFSGRVRGIVGMGYPDSAGGWADGDWSVPFMAWNYATVSWTPQDKTEVWGYENPGTSITVNGTVTDVWTNGEAVVTLALPSGQSDAYFGFNGGEYPWYVNGVEEDICCCDQIYLRSLMIDQPARSVTSFHSGWYCNPINLQQGSYVNNFQSPEDITNSVYYIGGVTSTGALVEPVQWNSPGSVTVCPSTAAYYGNTYWHFTDSAGIPAGTMVSVAYTYNAAASGTRSRATLGVQAASALASSGALNCSTSTANMWGSNAVAGVQSGVVTLPLVSSAGQTDAYVGIVGNTSVPDTVTINAIWTGSAPAATVNAVKTATDNSTVNIPSAIVSMAFPDSAGYFYIESSNRSSGIKIYLPAGGLEPSTPTEVAIAGTVATDYNGERCIYATEVTPVASTSAISPVALVNKAAGGGAYDYSQVSSGIYQGQQGMVGGTGNNNIGLLVKAWGTVSAGTGDMFYINDGSGPVLVEMVGGTLPTPGQYVSVKGVVSCQYNASYTGLVPVIRTQAGMVSVQ